MLQHDVDKGISENRSLEKSIPREIRVVATFCLGHDAVHLGPCVSHPCVIPHLSVLCTKLGFMPFAL